MTFPLYPLYKQSGNDWLGDIPSQWEVKRLKYLFNIMKRAITDEDEIVTCFRDGQVTLRRNRREDGFTNALKEIGYQGVKSGDLVIHAMDAFAGAVGVSDSDGKCSPVYSICEPKDCSVSSSYYGLLLRHMALAGFITSLAKGIRERSTDFRWSDASEIFFPVPSAAEQEHIIRFLDHEVGKIDALIAEQERLIALLKEKRQAVISHAVTKGLNPDAPMKDSGVEWLGQVPEHWDVNRIKFVTQVFEQGWSPQCESQPVESDEEFGVLKVGCVNGGIFRSEENKKLPSELEPITALSLKADDLLISRANTRELVGSAAIVPVNFDNLLLCDKLYRLRLFKNVVVPQFLSFFLSTNLVRTRIETEATGASQSMLNISQSTINNLYFPCPSIEEQIQIVDYVEKQQWQILQLVADARALTNLLNERRSALISAAVTGKIDVRGWQPPAAQ